MNLEEFPNYYRQYKWNAKHKLFGYPADSYPEFQWINSLEKRFNWLRENALQEETSSKYLIREMIQWGGSQNGVLQKFDDRSGEVNLYNIVQEIIIDLNDRERSISIALNLPGLGLTYASKLLRFIEPEIYGALDSRIRSALIDEEMMPKIYDGNNNSMVNGYIKFLNVLNDLKVNLEERNILKPYCNLSESSIWKPSEIEMALFCWADAR